MVEKGVNLELSVDGDVQLDRSLQRFGDNLSDLSPFFEVAADMVSGFVKQQFDSQGGRTQGWRALSPDYAAWKLAQVGSQPILVFTGRMRRSLITRTGESIRHISPLSMKWGTSVDYAIYHQRGTGKMPQRRIIDLTEDDRRSLMKLLQEFLAGDPKRFRR